MEEKISYQAYAEMDDRRIKAECRVTELEIEKQALEEEIKWKTVEVDGIPKKGNFILKIEAEISGWTYRAAGIVRGEFRLYHNGLSIKPNYYKLIEES